MELGGRGDRHVEKRKVVVLEYKRNKLEIVCWQWKFLLVLSRMWMIYYFLRVTENNDNMV